MLTAAIMLVVTGGVWLYFNIKSKPDYELDLEVSRMIRGKPGYNSGMVDEESGISEHIKLLKTNKRNTRLSIATIILGLFILLCLFIRALQT